MAKYHVHLKSTATLTMAVEIPDRADLEVFEVEDVNGPLA